MHRRGRGRQPLAPGGWGLTSLAELGCTSAVAWGLPLGTQPVGHSQWAPLCAHCLFFLRTPGGTLQLADNSPRPGTVPMLTGKAVSSSGPAPQIREAEAPTEARAAWHLPPDPQAQGEEPPEQGWHSLWSNGMPGTGRALGQLRRDPSPAAAQGRDVQRNFGRLRAPASAPLVLCPALGLRGFRKASLGISSRPYKLEMKPQGPRLTTATQQGRQSLGLWPPGLPGRGPLLPTRPGAPAVGSPQGWNSGTSLPSV